MKTIKSIYSKFGTEVMAILVLFVSVVLVYLFQVPKLGFYYDDWYQLWSGTARGASSMIGLFSTDRPFMGYLFFLTYKIFGNDPLGWQLYAIFLRLLGGISVYFIFRKLIPNNALLVLIMTELFLIFPGFLALPNAMTKQNHLFSFLSGLLSILFLILFFGSRGKGARWIFIFLSVGFTSTYLWLYEYMIGFEVFRLVIIAFLVNPHSSYWKWIKNVLTTYIPFGMVTGLFLVWRLFIFNSTRGTTNSVALLRSYMTSPVTMLLRLIIQTISDYFTVTLFAWFEQAYLLLRSSDLSSISIAIAFSAIISFGFYLFLNRYSNELDQEAPKWLFWTGLIVTIGFIFPVVLSNRSVDLLDTYKGYALHPLPGIVMTVTAIIWKFNLDGKKLIIVLLVFISILTQTLNMGWWSNYWQIQTNLWWQLSWRAPDFEDNTLVTIRLPENYPLQQNYEIWGPLNLIYRPDVHDLPAIQSEVLNPETVWDVVLKTNKWNKTRDIPVRLNYKNFLLVSQPTEESCIHVINGDIPVFSTSEIEIVRNIGGFSKITQIVSNNYQSNLPKTIFGEKSEENWCYYFQKADLALTNNDYQRISDLFDAITAVGYKPGDAIEVYPFLVGLVGVGRNSDAKVFAEKYILFDPIEKANLCLALQTESVYNPDLEKNRLELRELICAD